MKAVSLKRRGENVRRTRRGLKGTKQAGMAIKQGGRTARHHHHPRHLGGHLGGGQGGLGGTALADGAIFISVAHCSPDAEQALKREGILRPPSPSPSPSPRPRLPECNIAIVRKLIEILRELSEAHCERLRLRLRATPQTAFANQPWSLSEGGIIMHNR